MPTFYWLRKYAAAQGSRLRYRRPNLHGGRGAVGPGVIRNESKRERLGFSSLARMAEVQEPALRRLSIIRAGMAQHDDSTKQVLLKFLLELRARFRAQVQRHVFQSHSVRLVDLLQTVHERSALDRHAAVVLGDLRVGLEKLGCHIKLHADDVASGPAAANWKILAGSGACDRLSVDADLCSVSPSENTQEKCELGGLGRGEDNFHAAIPGIICFLADFQADAVFEMPVDFRIVVKVEIDAVAAGAVKISRQRGKSALQIRGAASGVVPIVANFVAVGRIKRQRIAIAVERAVQRHAGIDAVVERALDHIREFGFARRGEHAPIPHHVSNGRATFPVGPGIGQLERITESFALAARTDATGDGQLRSDEILPQNVECISIRGISGFQVIVGRAAASVHGAHGMTLEMRSRSEGSPTKMIDIIPRRLPMNPRVAGEKIAREAEMLSVAGHSI